MWPKFQVFLAILTRDFCNAGALGTDHSLAIQDGLRMVRRSLAMKSRTTNARAMIIGMMIIIRRRPGHGHIA